MQTLTVWRKTLNFIGFSVFAVVFGASAIASWKIFSLEEVMIEKIWPAWQFVPIVFAICSLVLIVYALFELSKPSLGRETKKERQELQDWLRLFTNYLAFDGTVEVTTITSEASRETFRGSGPVKADRDINRHHQMAIGFKHNELADIFMLDVEKPTSTHRNYYIWDLEGKYLLVRRKTDKGYGRAYYKKEK